MHIDCRLLKILLDYKNLTIVAHNNNISISSLYRKLKQLKSINGRAVFLNNNYDLTPYGYSLTSTIENISNKIINIVDNNSQYENINIYYSNPIIQYILLEFIKTNIMSNYNISLRHIDDYNNTPDNKNIFLSTFKNKNNQFLFNINLTLIGATDSFNNRLIILEKSDLFLCSCFQMLQHFYTNYFYTSDLLVSKNIINYFNGVGIIPNFMINNNNTLIPIDIKNMPIFCSSYDKNITDNLSQFFKKL